MDERISRVVGELRSHLARITEKTDRLRARGPLRVIGYRGHGTAAALHVKGRVLRDVEVPRAAGSDRVWRNLLHTLRRLDSAEVPRARIRARFGGGEWIAVADDEGFFEFRLHPHSLPESSALWHPVELGLDEPGAVVVGSAPVLIPPTTAEFAVVSDIDDTVIRTDATNLLRMARMVLLTNAHTRLPFEGVAAFYRALREGADGAPTNPVFYVSSSPWNLYDLLEEVWAVHGIPSGPFFLKDYDLTREAIFARGHHRHKLAAIRSLLEIHKLPFVLVGDSGQQDPEIYREVVREYPGRIRAVYIRDVSPARRDERVHSIVEEVRGLGVEMLLVGNTLDAAEHAATHGLIRPDALAEIRTDKARDEAAPEPLESLVQDGG